MCRNLSPLPSFRRSCLAPIALLVVACGASVPSLSAGVGPRGAGTLWVGREWRPEGSRTYVGPSAEVRYYPWRGQSYVLDGLAFGLEEAYLPLWTECCYGRREHLLVSFGHVPRQPYLNVGYEVTAALGYARLDWGSREPGSVSTGLRGALLIKPEWPGFLYDECSQPLLSYRPLFALEVGGQGLFPVAGSDRRARTELTGLAALRFDVSLLP